MKALDSKFSVDDNALYKHPDIAEMRDPEAVPPEERFAREKGVTYVKLDGDVGVLGNGAGLSMSTVDVVTFVGGRPANFCDLGGGGDAEGVVDALEVITRDPQVRSIFFNIFGGITRCDEVARGILQALDTPGHEPLRDRRPARRDERGGGARDPRRRGPREHPSRGDHAGRRPPGRGAGRVTDVWSARAEGYRTAVEQREGEDLDLIVAWCEGCETVLDVATGGGHVARRLRAAGQDVITCDPAPGMHPDVICRAEDLPFAESSFDAVVTRIAPHHFADVDGGGRRHGARLAEPRDRRGHALHERRTSRPPSASATRPTCAPTRRPSGGRSSSGAGLVVEEVRARREDPPVRRVARTHRLRRRRGGARPRAARPADVGRRRVVDGHEDPPARPEGSRLMAIIVDRDTRLVVQGLTGREGSFHGLRNRGYGTQVVAGVTPGKGGSDVEGVPIFDTVADAVRETGANTTMVFVPARFAGDAIYEAIDAGIGTVICIAEGLPAHEMLRIYTYLRPKGVTMIGPNCPGALSPGKANVGIIPAEIFTEGARRARLALGHADLPDRP